MYSACEDEDDDEGGWLSSGSEGGLGILCPTDSFFLGCLRNVLSPSASGESGSGRQEIC